VGLIDDIGEFIEDAADVPSDLVEAAASLFDGPGGVAGIFVSGATLFVGGPTALVPAIIAGVAVTEGVNALIKTRLLSPEERVLAEMVFGNSLPPFEKIILTNLGHPQGRAFVVPNAAGEALINLGDAYNDPIRYTKSYPEYGQLLIHELTHVWQIHHSGFLPGLICENIVTQVQNEWEEGLYEPGDGEKDWSNYNPEQQATIVARWYRGWGAEPCSVKSGLYRHVLEKINGSALPPAVQSLSVRTIFKRKFGEEGNVSVQNRYPRFIPGSRSLRKSLIGLRGEI
jgi:hypothetical protein